MTENLESIILEHLRHIRGPVDRIAEDVSDLKMRQSGVEAGLALVKREVAFGDETAARQQLSLDRLSDRIERI